MVKGYKYIIPFVFIWVGLILGISFLEAWIKFKAPGVTLSIGLGIGRLVFSAMNKVELVLATSIFVILIFSKDLKKIHHLFVFFCLAILLAQTFWLLPVLDERAIQIIGSTPSGPTYHHTLYIIAEIVKFFLLIFYGSTLLNSNKNGQTLKTDRGQIH